MENLDAQLNSFASRCFRDVADRDYICARMCYRAGLISQFHWSALQAFEKYFKAIFLYNRVKAKDIGHNLAKAQEYVQNLPFEIKLSGTSEDLLVHLDRYGRFRYFEASYFIHGPKLVELDKAVWELRRYCRVMDYRLDTSDGASRPMLELEIQRNDIAEKRPPHRFHIVGGSLEAIITKRSHPARPPLIWQNAFYGSSHRKCVRVPMRLYAANSPLYLHPEILDYVIEYVYIPGDVVAAYRMWRQSNNASQLTTDGGG